MERVWRRRRWAREARGGMLVVRRFVRARGIVGGQGGADGEVGRGVDVG